MEGAEVGSRRVSLHRRNTRRVRLRRRKTGQQRCALCHDGPTGLVMCQGCETLLHVSCLVDAGGCPTLGCNEREPAQAAAREVCPLHGPDALKLIEIAAVFGGDISKACRCEPKSPPKGEYFERQRDRGRDQVLDVIRSRRKVHLMLLVALMVLASLLTSMALVVI
jgi:hypothetical protein